MASPRNERNDHRPFSTNWTGSEDPTAAKIMFLVLAAGAVGFFIVGMSVL